MANKKTEKTAIVPAAVSKRYAILIARRRRHSETRRGSDTRRSQKRLRFKRGAGRRRRGSRSGAEGVPRVIASITIPLPVRRRWRLRVARVDGVYAESCQRAAAVGRSILNAVPLFAASLGLRCNLTPFFFYMFTTYATRSRTRSSSASSRAARPGPPRRSRRRPGSRPPGRRGRTSRAGRDRPGARADPSWVT